MVAREDGEPWRPLEGPLLELLDAAAQRREKHTQDWLQALEPAFRPGEWRFAVDDSYSSGARIAVVCACAIAMRVVVWRGGVAP